MLFVGTKKQARDTIRDVAEAADMPYVNHRWLGGLLTNFQTISLRIRRLHDLERYEAEGQLALLPTRERMAAQADLAKLRANLGGVKNMQRVPDAMFVIDLKTEAIAVKEAQRLRIPIIGLVDTNCDPDGIDFVVPGNDDAIRSCALITQAIGQVVSEGHASSAPRRSARARKPKSGPASRRRRVPGARPRNRPRARPRSRPQEAEEQAAPRGRRSGPRRLPQEPSGRRSRGSGPAAAAAAEPQPPASAPRSRRPPGPRAGAAPSRARRVRRHRGRAEPPSAAGRGAAACRQTAAASPRRPTAGAGRGTGAVARRGGRRPSQRRRRRGGPEDRPTRRQRRRAPS